MANVPQTVWQFLWSKYEPDERRQHRVDWETMAEAFLKFCRVDVHNEASLKSVAGALSSLSQTVLERAASSKKNGASSHSDGSSAHQSSSSSSNRLHSTRTRSQTSVVDSGEDTQPMDSDSPHAMSSSPPTPPLEPQDQHHPTTFNINNPEYRTLLSQLRALVCPCLGYLFPRSSLRQTRFLVEGVAPNPTWYLRSLSDAESDFRVTKVPPFPQELTVELLSTIKSQMVKRTSSTLASPSLSPSRPKPGDLTSDNRTKTLSSIKHGPSSSMDLDDSITSPSKRFKTASGAAAAVPVASSASSLSTLLSNESAHLRILQLEKDQEELRKEVAVLKAELELLRKPRSLVPF